MIPCRILVIAPYESMKNILLFICKAYPNNARMATLLGSVLQ